MKSVRIAFAAVALAALTGCSVTNPIQTQVVYSASDGARVTVGATIEAKNLIVLTDAQGEPGALIGAVTNRSAQDTIVTIDVVGAGRHEVPLTAGQSFRFVGEDVLRFDAVDARPGQTMAITVSSGNEGATSATVPVLDGTLPEYAEVIAGL
ncbi:MAG: hypothetical protein M3Y20_01470 [Actinomycetota bacterium]|nr:hypothetical protein [Actinomycetota bacterium]